MKTILLCIGSQKEFDKRDKACMKNLDAPEYQYHEIHIRPDLVPKFFSPTFISMMNYTDRTKLKSTPPLKGKDARNFIKSLAADRDNAERKAFIKKCEQNFSDLLKKLEDRGAYLDGASSYGCSCGHKKPGHKCGKTK